MTRKKIRPLVFGIPFVLLVAGILFSIFSKKVFLTTTDAINTWILDSFDWLFSLSTLVMLATVLFLFFSPVGQVRIGGEGAKPILNRWRWFAITLCSTVATGILFWGTGEPIYHLMHPSNSLGIVPESAEATEFALSTLYLHWSFTPYAIYSIPTVAFAVAFYNRKRKFSLSSTLFPFFKEKEPLWLSRLVDSVSLFALVAGMAASLGTGVLTLSGGLNELFNVPKTAYLLGGITLVIVASFIISASTGLLKGIRILSTINVIIFILLAALIFIIGDSMEILSLSADGLANYFTTFFEKSIFTILHPQDDWGRNWTVFYWANWMAWAPIAALFLGRIAYGYTIREILIFNWLLPSLFAVVWMSIFSGTALNLHNNTDLNLISTLENNGVESVMYAILEQFPYHKILAFVFVAAIFLSYVTAADSNTEAMSGVSTDGISPESPAPPTYIKIIWGIIIGATAFVMVNFAGIKGIKMLSNLGGLPALFLVSAINIGLIVAVWKKKLKIKPDKE